jgi:hypothetical protein
VTGQRSHQIRMQIIAGLQDVFNVCIRGKGIPIIVPEHVDVDQGDAPSVGLTQPALGSRQHVPIGADIPHGVTVVHRLECLLLRRRTLHKAILLLVVLSLAHLDGDACGEPAASLGLLHRADRALSELAHPGIGLGLGEFHVVQLERSPGVLQPMLLVFCHLLVLCVGPEP